MKKTLVIVSSEADRKYATYIQQLISAFDDGDEQVGTKDGTVDAVVWDEKHYKDNLNKINSTNYLLFIGDTDAAKSARSNLDTRFTAAGMSFGWLDNQAFMRVEDNSLNKDNLDEFKELCSKYGKTFEEELDLHFSPSDAESVGKPKEELAPQDFLPIPLGFLSPVLGIASAVAMHGKTMVDMAGQAINFGGDLLQGGKARDQQYSLLSLIVYMDALPEFLGE